MEVSGQPYMLATLLPGKRVFNTNLIGGWVCARASLGISENKKISCTIWDLNPDYPAYSLLGIVIVLSWLATTESPSPPLLPSPPPPLLLVLPSPPPLQLASSSSE